MDAEIATFLGWGNVEINDIGSAVGYEPESNRLSLVPHFTLEFPEVIKVVKRLNADGYLLTLEQTRDARGEIIYDATFLKQGDNSTYRYYEHSNPVVAIAGAALAVAGIERGVVDSEKSEPKPVINSMGLIEVDGDCYPVKFIRSVSRIITEKFVSGNFAYILHVTLADTDKKGTYVYDSYKDAVDARDSVISALKTYYSRGVA